MDTNHDPNSLGWRSWPDADSFVVTPDGLKRRSRTADDVLAEIKATEQALYDCDYNDPALQAKVRGLYDEMRRDFGGSWDRRASAALNTR